VRWWVSAHIRTSQKDDIIIVILFIVPSAPTRLVAEALSNDQIKITWGPVADNGGADVVNFVLKVIQIDTGTLAIDDTQLKSDQMEVTSNGLKNNKNYRYVY